MSDRSDTTEANAGDLLLEVERLRFFAKVSERLGASLNLDRTLAQIAELAVPRLADACMISFAEDDGVLRVGAIATPRGVELWRQEGVRRRDAVPAATRVRESGVAEVHPALAPERVAEFVPAGEMWDPIRDPAPTSVLAVPLRARASPLGALILFACHEHAPYRPDDLAEAIGFANRSAVAIDNAMLYRDRSKVARVLQQSLLPPRLPEVEHLEFGARYRPVTVGSDIGGDFYDAFQIGADSWGLAVGDVCGKGVEAATVTGLARHTIRAVAQQVGSPAEVLRALNDVVRQEHDTFCTVALARATPSSAGTRLDIAAGGHPPPLVLRASGQVDEVAASGTLLGMLPDVAFATATVYLGPGDALVVYTDGVTEARAGRHQFGTENLARVLAGSAGLDADTIAERIVAEVAAYAAGPQTDDIAVLVARARTSDDG